MVFHRRSRSMFGRRKRIVFGRRRARSSRRGNAGVVALRKVKALGRVARPEMKEIQITKNAFVRDSWLEVGKIAEGTGPADRTGTKIMLRHLSFKGEWNVPETNSDASQTFRLLIIRWWGQLDPTNAQIFSPSGAANHRVWGWYTAPDERAQKFSVVVNKIFTLRPLLTNGALGRWPSKVIWRSVRLGWKKYFDGNLAIDGLKGRLYMYWESDTGSTAPTCLIYTKVKYTDA